MFSSFKKIPFTRNIILLSAISFFTDISSEMLYPVFPLYFQAIGYSIVMIGVLEGLAEVLAGVSKSVIGYYSDKLQKKRRFIIAGYGLSALAKPAIGLTQNFSGVSAARLADRFGKGIRTTPRDAILVEESDIEHRGIVFGFHRAMDTLGASIGPVITLLLLYYFTRDYHQIFIYSLIPGVFAIILSFMLKKEKTVNTDGAEIAKPTFSIKQFLSQITPEYRKLIIAFLCMSVLNSTDMFLLIRAKQLGASDLFLIIIYIFYNLIFALAAIPVGNLSDTIGFKKVFLVGIVLVSAVYGILGYGVKGLPLLFGVFALYGIYAAIKEGVAKAWISLYIPKQYMGTGLGLYFTLTSFAFLIGNIITGFIWMQFGPETAFAVISLSFIPVLLYCTTLSNIIPIESEESKLGNLGCNSGH
ncbi:MAG: MFS transporter [bacterium]|nr:MFS transporter [bacterium]